MAEVSPIMTLKTRDFTVKLTKSKTGANKVAKH